MESEINLTILHLSDLHFGRYNKFEGKKSVFIDCCDTIIKVINNFYKENRIPKAELLLISGDMGSSGEEEDYVQGHPELNASYFLKTYFSEYISDNLIMVPGNHDLEWAGRKGATKKYKFREYYNFLKKIGVINQIPEYYKMPHFYKSYKTPNSIILGLNSCMFTSYDGDTKKAKHYQEYQHRSLFNEDKLFDILLKIKKKHPEGQFKNPYFRIALMHHNIYPFKGNSIKIVDTTTKLEKNEIQFLKKMHYDYEFDIFIHGHRHENFILTIENSLIIGGGSLLVQGKERTFKMGVYYKQIRKNSFNIISLTKKVEKGNFYYHIILEVNVFHFIINYDTDYSVEHKGTETRKIIYEKEVIDLETEHFFNVVEKIESNPEDLFIPLKIIESARSLEGFQDFNYDNQLTISYRNIYDNIDKEVIVEKIFNAYNSLIKGKKPENAKIHLIENLLLLYNERDVLKEVQSRLDSRIAEEISKHKRLQIIEIQKQKQTTSVPSGIPRISPLGGQKHFFAWTSVRRLMEGQGLPVFRSTVYTLIDHLEIVASEITKQAIEFTKNAKRKKVTEEDLKLAIKYF